MGANQPFLFVIKGKPSVDNDITAIVKTGVKFPVWFFSRWYTRLILRWTRKEQKRQRLPGLWLLLIAWCLDSVPTNRSSSPSGTNVLVLWSSWVVWPSPQQYKYYCLNWWIHYERHSFCMQHSQCGVSASRWYTRLILRLTRKVQKLQQQLGCRSHWRVCRHNSLPTNLSSS